MQQWIKKVAGFGIASFLSDFSHEMTVSLIPVLVAQFVGPAAAPLYLGIIASFTDSFASFLRLVSGFLSDQITRKKTLIATGYALSAFFSTIVGFTHSVWQVLVCRVLSFTGSGLREPPRDALIAATVEKEYYGRAFGLKNAMDTLGSLVGPLVAFAIAGSVSVRGIFALSFIPGILAVFAILFLTKDIPITAQHKSLFIAFKQNFRLLPHSFLIYLGIIFIFDLSNFNKLLLIARAQEIITADPAHIAQLLVMLYALFNITRASVEFLIGLVSDYINRILLLAIFGCVPLAITAALLISPYASIPYCMLIFVLSGISTAAITTLKKASAADMLPEHIRGLGYGILQASEGFAALIANMLIGFLWTAIAPSFGFGYVITLSLVALILLLILSMTGSSRNKRS